ncbi:MAG: hypothetical protein ACLQVA_04650 [Candidatus Brocadiia bacterium]
MRKAISTRRSWIILSLAVINLLGLLAVFRSLRGCELGARY